MSATQGDSPDPSSHRPGIWDEDPNIESVEDPDDDDMDFAPDGDGDESEEVEYFEIDADEEIDEEDLEAAAEEDEDEDEEFQDATVGDAGESGVQIELTMDQHSGEATNLRVVRPDGGLMNLSRQHIMSLIGNDRFRGVLARARGVTRGGGGETDEEDEEDEEIGFITGRRRRRPKRSNIDLPPVPNPKGKELMESGNFGASEPYRDRQYRCKKKLARKVLARELGLDHRDIRRENRLLSQTLIPGSPADSIIQYDSRCYSGQFSDDGNFFFTCSQDFNVRMYDTSNPYDWKYYKIVHYPFGQWTITDASLSRDNKFLAFSSIRPVVCLAATDPESGAEPHHLDFSNLTGSTRGGRHRHVGQRHFGIWSIRFSGDGHEIVAGTSEHAVYVYDIEAGRSILRIPGHDDDVNAVCFGDASSPHILYSGSDDSLIKVWDRRSMGDSREAGVFIGHTEGLTYVDSKGDGRYVLSNGKDQTMKLWDLRSMASTEKASQIDCSRYMTGFDYRFMSFSDEDYTPHPDDCSVVTFRGHSVLKTLIRCHFSPPGSTDSRYVYSGSEDGCVYVYNMDATLASKVNVNQATYHTRPQHPSMYQASGPHVEDINGRGAWKTCVRDASWHPTAPVIAATSWNGWGMSTGTCTVHSWNDSALTDESELGMGQRLDSVLRPQQQYYSSPGRQGAGNRGGLLSRIVRRNDGGDDGNW